LLQYEHAENYDDSHDGKFVLPMHSEILRLIGEVKIRVLFDIGCGTSNILSLLNRHMFSAWHHRPVLCKIFHT